MDRDTLTEATNSTAEKATPTTQWSESAQQRVGAAQSSAFAGAESSRNLAGLATEQPLVRAGLGLAIGACLGAMFPSTETEDQLLGGSDATKSRPSGQYEKAKGAASATVEAATDAAQQHGPMASDRRETGPGSAATLGRSEPEGKARATRAAHAEPAHGG